MADSVVDLEIHALARCCWCERPFVRGAVALGDLTPWMCATAACRDRQIRHAMFVELKGKGRRCRFVPLPRQVETIELVERADGPTYVLIGGAAGGSKSKGLREIAHKSAMATNGLRVLLLRRTYKELDQTHLRDVEVEAPEMGALAVPSAKLVRYPNGSTLQFGHCETTADAANYLSAEYDLIIFDELVTFEEGQFLMIASRARSTKPGVHPKILAGTNPGGPQSHWVRARFMDKTVDLDEYPDYDPNEWAFIPSRLDDNPYLDKQYERKLLALPPELRRAYRDGDWDIFPGQYFPEWRKATHVTAQHVTHDPTLPRVLLMDWGFVKPGYVGWMVHLPEGHAYLEDEYVPKRVTAFDQGFEVGSRCKQRGLRKILYLVYDHQMETPQTDSGEPILETFMRGMRKAGVSVATRKADKDRTNGWPRMRGWLQMAPDGKPWLQVSPECRYAIRTIPSLVSDATDPEDVDTDGEDHAGDAIRYWAMSRPVAVSSSTAKRYPPMSLGAIKAASAAPQGILARR